MNSTAHPVLLAALTAALFGSDVAAQGARDSAHVVIESLGHDVYAAIRQEPLGLAVHSNSLFIVNDHDVVVVDAQFTRAATLENIAALRRITSKPVSYVINTHWHDDHVAGNQVYQDSFPGVTFLAAPATRADLIEMGRPNRVGTYEYAPPTADRYERLLAMGLGIDSLPVSRLEKESVTSALKIIRQYVAERAGHREVLPDTIAGRSTRLVRGQRVIELHWFGRGNTGGDLVAYLPNEHVIATGDLLVAPVPFGFSSYPSEWIGVLDSIAALAPRIIVPGHGPVMRDLNYLRTVQQLLQAARTGTRAAFEKGMNAEAVQRTVTLEDWRRHLAGDEKWLNTMFQQFFRSPVLGRLFQEAQAGPLK